MKAWPLQLVLESRKGFKNWNVERVLKPGFELILKPAFWKKTLKIFSLKFGSSGKIKTFATPKRTKDREIKSEITSPDG